MKKHILYMLLLLSFNSYSQPNRISWDSLIFESHSPHIIFDTSKMNIWQIGKPQKEYLNSAYSDSLCLVTDTINYYPVNNLSFFDLYISNKNHQGYPQSTFIEFKHKYDSDENNDGLFLTISMDNGKNWMTIFDFFDSIWLEPGIGADYEYYFENIYSTDDNLINGSSGFSGRSDDWESTLIGWYVLYASINKSTQDEVFPDTLIIRFNFISDENDNGKEGWLIDNIRFYSIYLSGGAIKDTDNSLLKIYPNPADNYLRINFSIPFKEMHLDIISLKGDILYSRKYNYRENIEIKNLDLKSGFYILQCILDNEKRIIHKLLINN
jgi:hypothetical protein